MSDISKHDDDDALAITAEERDRLLAPVTQRTLALCVSGGADSMALMHLVAEWAKDGRHAFRSDISSSYDLPVRRDRRPEQLPRPVWLEGVSTREDLEARGGPAPIVVLTVNHGLRAQADQEAQLVARCAAKLGLPHQTLVADTPPPESGIQEWARDLRRGLILELLDAELWRLRSLGLEETGLTRRKVVMAHHLDDQAETVLMRLARGSGLGGLGGMAQWDAMDAKATPVRSYRIEADVFRPFLCVPKSRLVATLKERGASFVEDASNADDRFERVRIRKALGVLGQLGITHGAIARSAGRLREANVSLHAFERRWHKEIIDRHGGLLASVPSPRFALRGAFAEVRLLAQLLDDFGGSSRPAELSQVERLREQLMGADGGFKGATLGGCRIQLDGGYEGGRLLIYREGNGAGLEKLPLGPGQSVEWDDRFRVTCDDAAPGNAEVRALGAAAWARLKREVDGLDELKLKAAAMATMPAIWRGEELVSVPHLELLFSGETIPAKAATAWARWRFAQAGLYKVVFLAGGGLADG